MSSEESLSKGRAGVLGQLLLPAHLLLKLLLLARPSSSLDQNLSPRFCERLMKEVSKKALHEKEKKTKEDSRLLRYFYFFTLF